MHKSWAKRGYCVQALQQKHPLEQLAPRTLSLHVVSDNQRSVHDVTPCTKARAGIYWMQVNLGLKRPEETEAK